MGSDTPVRRLLVTRRAVGLPARGAYLRAWDGLRGAVDGLGGRAWVFRREEDPELCMEFVEWRGDATLPDLPEIRQALEDLEGFGRGDTELWREPRERGVNEGSDHDE